MLDGIKNQVDNLAHDGKMGNDLHTFYLVMRQTAKQNSFWLSTKIRSKTGDTAATPEES